MRAGLAALLLLTNVATAASKAAMNVPAAWQDRESQFGMSNSWRLAGCQNNTLPWEIGARGCILNWFTNNTFIPGEPTIGLDSPFRTFFLDIKDEKDDITRRHPWRAPGSAAVHSPCGIDGGNPKGCPVGNPSEDGCSPGGYGNGPDGRSLESNTKPANWTAGQVHEVAFGFLANHGGGYQYRLCPKPKNNWELTEECFQKMPLMLMGDRQWIQYFGHPLMRTEIRADRVYEGVVPAKSQWTKIPIPSCGGRDGGVFDFHCSVGTQFIPPAPGVSGFWGTYNFGQKQFGRGRLQDISVVDKIHLPIDTPPGDYVIQFRNDNEFEPKVFNTCGDVTILPPEK